MRPLLVSASSACLAASLAMPAYAQQSEKRQSDNTIGEIIVTAQKRSENLQDVPIAVTALASEELAGASIQGQMTLPKLTPNLNFTVNSAFASAYIRGVGTQFANPGLESSVSIYFDDTYIPRAGSAQFSFNDIERIEVLKGPQGTLYGRNATGGAIRIITTDPKPEFEGKGSVTFGTDARLQVDGVLNIPIAEGIAVRFAGKHDENSGYTRNLYPNSPSQRLGSRNEEIYTGKLLIQPSDALTVKISGDFSIKDDTEGVGFANLFPGLPEQLGVALGGCVSTDVHEICNDDKSQNFIKQWGVAGRIDYDFGPATLSSITAYRFEREFGRSDLDGTSADLQPASGKPQTKQWTEEIQLASSVGGPLKYVIGGYYLHERSQYAFTVYGSGIAGGFGPLFPQLTDPVFMGFGQITAESYAPFAQVDYDFTDQLSLSVGARYTWETKKLIFNYGGLGEVDRDTGFPIEGTFIRAPFGPCTATVTTACEAPRDTAKVKKFTPKVTLSYRPIDDLMLYATFSRGFKSGGLNLPSFGAVDKVRPEVLDDYEVGFKYQRGNVRFNGAGFYYDYKDLQIQLTDQTTGGTRVKNAAGARIWGLEGDLTWLPTSAIELGVGGGYLNSKYKNFVGDAYLSCADILSRPAPAPGATDPSSIGFTQARAGCTAQGGLGLGLVGGQNLSGRKLVNAPEFSGYFRAAYTADLGGSGSLKFSTVMNYRTTAYFDPANLFEDKNRFTLSGRIQYTSADERRYVALWGENLTNVDYLSVKSPQSAGGWRVAAPPRQIYVTAGINF